MDIEIILLTTKGKEMNMKQDNVKLKFTGQKAQRSGLSYNSYNDRPIRRIYTPVPSFDKPLSSSTEIPKKEAKRSKGK